MAYRLEWRGDAVVERVMRAAQAAIDDTTDEAAKDAEGSHWWGARTGTLESQIVNEPARRFGLRAVGKFGSTAKQGFYGLFLEHRQPFLRPAADRNFRDLARRIKERIR
jgi:hypothetical protein